MNNNQKEKKMYTKGGYIGFINYIQQEEVIVQSINGCLVRCKNKNLTKNNYEGKEEVAFDYFIKNGNIVAIAFPIYRAGNPIESSLKITKDDRANAQNHPQFGGTLSELRELVQKEKEAQKAAEAAEAAKKALEEKEPAPAPEEPLKEVEETLPEEEVPEEAYEYDEDEAEEYENDSSEYEKYDDDSYYEFDDKPSSKREWR